MKHRTSYLMLQWKFVFTIFGVTFDVIPTYIKAHK